MAGGVEALDTPAASVRSNERAETDRRQSILKNTHSALRRRVC
jgi:hypothetical protein